MDMISKLPPCIIETILCLLPIQEAVRTSILSKEWRYHWIKISKLAFDEDTFQVSTEGVNLSAWGNHMSNKVIKRNKISKRRKLFNAIHQVLLTHEGPIHEFALCMEVDGSCVEVDHILQHLSKLNTVKILKLDFDVRSWGYTLPISLFSLYQLTDLYLINKRSPFDEGSSFNPFHEAGESRCRLITLYLDIWTYDKTIMRFLSSCALLKRLTLKLYRASSLNGRESNIVDLFKCLPVIEYLSVSFFIVMSFAPQRLPKELPTSLDHLKYLCMEGVHFNHKHGLRFLVFLIRSSPNLEKLKLVMYQYDIKAFNKLEDYSDIMLEHLTELEILHFSNTENELDFVKLVLAASPVLKKVRILPRCPFNGDEKLRISKILSRTPRASSMVKIQLESSMRF